MKKALLLLAVIIMAMSSVLCLAEDTPVISFESESLTVPVGKSVTPKTVITPKSKLKLEWSSSNEEVATVSAKGAVKGVSVGEAVITVKAVDNDAISASCTVTVVMPVKKISFRDKSISLAAGITQPLQVTVEPEDATNKALDWSSSNEKVAKVNADGFVTGLSKGSARITAQARDGSGTKASVTVKVDVYDLVLTTTEPQTATYYYGSGHFVIKAKGKTGCVDVPEINSEMMAVVIGGYGSGEFEVKPVKPGTDTITVKAGSVKTIIKVYVSPDFGGAIPPDPVVEKDNEIGCLEAETYEGHTYQVFYSGRSWDKAKAFCEKHGGHLATITGKNEQKFIERYLAKAEKKESYWIGLNSGKGKVFTSWITKEPLEFTKWMTGNPDRNKADSCVRIAASTYEDVNKWTMNRGTWDDEDKDYPYINGFICEWDEENSPKALPAR